MDPIGCVFLGNPNKLFQKWEKSLNRIIPRMQVFFDIRKSIIKKNLSL